MPLDHHPHKRCGDSSTIGEAGARISDPRVDKPPTFTSLDTNTELTKNQHRTNKLIIAPGSRQGIHFAPTLARSHQTKSAWQRRDCMKSKTFSLITAMTFFAALAIPVRSAAQEVQNPKEP